MRSRRRRPEATARSASAFCAGARRRAQRPRIETVAHLGYRLAVDGVDCRGTRRHDWIACRRPPPPPVDSARERRANAIDRVVRPSLRPTRSDTVNAVVDRPLRG